MATFALKPQSWIVAETIWPANPRTFSIQPLTEKMSCLGHVLVSACHGMWLRGPLKMISICWHSDVVLKVLGQLFFFFPPDVCQMPSFISCIAFERHLIELSWHTILLSIAQMDFRTLPTFQRKNVVSKSRLSYLRNQNFWIPAQNTPFSFSELSLIIYSILYVSV